MEIVNTQFFEFINLNLKKNEILQKKGYKKGF